MSSGHQTSAAGRPAKRRAAPNDEEVTVATGAGRAKACTSCRQVKLKCDSAETFPASCSRCTAKSLDCRMDADFKRIPTRHKLKEITSELSNLKEVIRSSAAPQKLHVNYSRSSNSHNSLSPEGGFLEPPAVGQKARSFCDVPSSGFYGIEPTRNSAFCLGEQHLGDVRLSGLTIVDLFEHFQQHYYRHGVVLDTSLTLHDLIKQSPILFWTIIMISSRHHPQTPTVFQGLKQPYEHLLASYIIRAIHSIHDIHAILILVTWPIPVRSQPEDPSWNFCGLITNSARSLGYHQPGREKEYGFPRATSREIELRSQTWLQIFHLNMTYSSRLGVPSALADESTLCGLVQITTDFDIPSDTATQLQILRTLARTMQCLQLQTDPITLDSLVLMASGEIETLRTTCRRKWIAETELQFLGAKLFLYGWSLKGQALEPDLGILAPIAASEPLLSKKLILYEALKSAADYIHVFNEVGSSKTPGHRNPSSANEELLPQIYFPKYYFFTLYYAALTLYHFLSTLPQSSISDQDLARNHIRLAHTVLCRCASHDAECEWPRLAQNIEMVGQFINSGRRLPLEAQINSRQGAGLFYDGMLKIAVLKAEMGGRNWASDLTQPKPYDDNGLMMKAPEMPQGPTSSSSSSAATAFGVHDPQQQYVPQEWDDAFWGWDLSMLDSAILQQDWNGLNQWQP